MSDALDFLVKARPEAMGHYFAFLKDAGSRLDPKTRALISVITKVHGQTERGLKQYLKRALRDGCSGVEVIDALLMAFPALGLAKIVWAVDVILAMDLPAFSEEAMKAAVARAVAPGVASAATEAPAAPAKADARWHDLMPVDALERGGVAPVECDGRLVFVAKTPDGVRVHDGRCPHRGTSLAGATLDGATLTCPKHGWVFDAVTGECTANGDEGLARLESRIDAGRLRAFW